MKSLIEIALKLIPIAVIVLLVYILLGAGSKTLDEGLKLSLSALLGALASYIFIQYSEFMKRIDEAKRRHNKALHSIDIKLNMQLNWLADITYHLGHHVSIVEKVISGSPTIVFDTSSYRGQIQIDREIHDVNNLSLKNELLALQTSFDKIENDINTITSGHKFGIDAVVSGGMPIEDYVATLPHHLEGAKAILAFTENGITKTKRAISSARVLANDSKDSIGSIRRYLVIQEDPENYDSKINSALEKLNNQILQTKNESRNEIRDVEQGFNKQSDA